MKNKLMLKTVITWLPKAIIVTGVCGLLYFASQQQWRMSANVPQIGLAEEIAASAQQGLPLNRFINTPFDIATIQAPWVIIYDVDQMPTLSSAMLNGKTPIMPPGLLDHAKDVNEVRVTWQPQAGVRQAIVVKAYLNKDGQSEYVVVGRSLTEVELQIEKLGFLVAIGYIALMLFTFLANLAGDRPTLDKKLSRRK